MRVMRYRQSTLARLRYGVDLSNWLAEGETIVGLDLTTDDALTVEELAPVPPSMTEYQMMVSGGMEGMIHPVTVVATTSLGQKRVDQLQFIIEGSA